MYEYLFASMMILMLIILEIHCRSETKRNIACKHPIPFVSLLSLIKITAYANIKLDLDGLKDINYIVKFPFSSSELVHLSIINRVTERDLFRLLFQGTRTL